jgi:hypothetical protein
MGEISNIVDGRRIRTSALAFVLSVGGLSLTGCGAITEHSNTAHLEPCGGTAAFTAKGSNTAPITSMRDMLRTASEDVSTLYKLTGIAGSSVKLSPNASGVVSVKSSGNSLDLGFNSNNFGGGYDSLGAYDSIDFTIRQGKPDIAPGSIACLGNDGNIYPNVAYVSLETAIKELKALSQ